MFGAYNNNNNNNNGYANPNPNYSNYDFLSEASFSVGDIVNYCGKNYSVHVVRADTVTLATRLTFLYDIPHASLRLVRRSASSLPPQEQDDDEADAGLADSLVQSNVVIRRIHKSDPDMRHFTVQAAKLVGIAARHFVEDLARRSYAAEQATAAAAATTRTDANVHRTSESPSFDGVAPNRPATTNATAEDTGKSSSSVPVCGSFPPPP
eukprot:CAMPEP_0182476588 /NCGR_PEP_ID=MMETSP1319-20130603/29368_1 /TAXON_ID=172717 /ORGANISM="Bolidomonas pacifica, Strain RCC208" /LENGTH=208 /DNA_ID=CAMNT_0024677685 /DNA_START=164 /DNA_END=787 /DNA_ORIENTATION=+